MKFYGIISWHDYQTMPFKVEYQLANLGTSLCGLIAQIDDWVVDNFDDMIEHSKKAVNS